MLFSRFIRHLLLCFMVCGLLNLISSTQAQNANASPQKWEKNIQEFEKKDAASPPKTGQVVFVGSSSIVGWDLKKAFPDLDALNRGFGGSEVSDSLHFADRLILNYKPRKVFLYAGDNDIAKGKSAQRVFDDFVQLAELIEKTLPKTSLVFIAIKPSIKRWKIWPEMRRANDMIAGYARAKANVEFADIAPATLGKNGEPDPALFKSDGLHLNGTGYEAWNKVILSFLKD